MFFPQFAIKTITFYFVVIFTAWYLLSCILYHTLNTGNWTCTLYKMGAKYAPAISKKGHIFRLVLPVFIHTDIFHVFWNALSFFMVGFSVEASLGSKRNYFLLLLVGGIGGNLMSAVFDPYDVGVGASTSLFAVLGTLILWYLFNIQRLGPGKL